MSDQPMSEDDVRRLRDNIYGPSDDHTWRVCGQNWCKPENVRWLKEHQPKPRLTPKAGSD